MHPRDQIVMIIDKIYRQGMTTTSGGNISIMDENGDMWVTPSAVDKGNLRAADIMCVKKDGTIVGPHKPSSEYPFHKAIFDARPEFKAVIHAHPPALVSFSIARVVPDVNVMPYTRKYCGKVGFAPYGLPGSDELGEKIAAQFVKGDDGVIMENHGTVVAGTDMLDAYRRFESFEYCSRTIINAKTLGDCKTLTDAQHEAYLAKVSVQLPEMASVEHPSCEKGIRKEIVDILQRSCRQNMMAGSFGTVSVRWKGNDFVITPADMMRWDIEVEDLVQIKDGHREAGKTPDATVRLHQEIYKRHPHVNSIITTPAPYLMGFGVAHKKFDVRTIPESWIFLQDVNNYAFGDHDKVVSVLGNDTPVVIVENEMVVVTSDKLLQTFDKLEVAEFSAMSLVQGGVIGQLQPIGNAEIEDLRKKFLG